MNKVKVIFTGGTIAMRIDAAAGGAVPALSGGEILKEIRGLEKWAEVEVEDYARLPGPHMAPEKMMELSRHVAADLAREDLTGVVITHGTDTLEETAFLLDLTLNSPKPVVLVGAIRNSSELGWDGPANLLGAIRVAADDQARNQGVLVVMNDQINPASEVTKTHTEELGAFQCPDFGPIGIVEKDRVLFYREPLSRQHIDVSAVEPRVDLHKMAAGTDDRLIRMSVDSGAKGLVIEGLGRGNVTPEAFPGIRYAVEKGLPVVLVSRCLRGRIFSSYGYEGAGRRLRDLGVIFGENLPGQKARIKLMVALGKTSNIAEIRDIFERGRY
jgi:L-asparaginase